MQVESCAVTFTLRRKLDDARLELLRGNWDGALELADRLLREPAAPVGQRFAALLVQALVRARRGLIAAAGDALLEEASRLAQRAEWQLVGRVAAARAEVAWHRADRAAVIHETALGFEAAHGQCDAWIYGELAYWRWRAQPDFAAPEGIAAPWRAMIQDDWQAAADAWSLLGMPFERALALSAGSENALREALDIFEKLGAEPCARFVRQRLRASGVRGIPRGPRASTRCNPAGLTRREVQVLTLLAGGHTNAELARRLHLSAKTIDHHVSSILGKLGVRSRTEAVAAAFGLGIVKPVWRAGARRGAVESPAASRG